MHCNSQQQAPPFRPVTFAIYPLMRLTCFRVRKKKSLISSIQRKLRGSNVHPLSCKSYFSIECVSLSFSLSFSLDNIFRVDSENDY